MAPVTEEDWHQERLTMYLRISHSVREIQAHLRKAEAAIDALKTQSPDLVLTEISTDVAQYNSAHSDDVPVDLDTTKDVRQAEKVFEGSKKQAKEIYEFRWRSGHEDEQKALREVEVLNVARREVNRIIEEDLPKWEKRVSDIAGVARMLTA